MPTLESASLYGCNTSMKKGKKRHFTESELEIVVNDVEPRREILSGPPSAGINMKRKGNDWERVCEAVGTWRGVCWGKIGPRPMTARTLFGPDQKLKQSALRME